MTQPRAKHPGAYLAQQHLSGKPLPCVPGGQGHGSVAIALSWGIPWTTSDLIRDLNIEDCLKSSSTSGLF